MGLFLYEIEIFTDMQMCFRVMFLQKGSINNRKLLAWSHKMLKIVQHNKYNYALHSPDYREE